MSYKRMFLNDLTKLENAQQLSNNNGLIIALFFFRLFSRAHGNYGLN